MGLSFSHRMVTHMLRGLLPFPLSLFYFFADVPCTSQIIDLQLNPCLYFLGNAHKESVDLLNNVEDRVGITSSKFIKMHSYKPWGLHSLLSL